MVKKLLTLAILALGVGMAVPPWRARIEGSLVPIKDEIGRRLVPRRLDAMANQLDARLGRAEGLPGSFDGWLRRDYTGSPEDPWGNNYYLIPGRRDYTVGTMGPDGVQGTGDDLTVTRPYPVAGR
jgi:hypothetical protein